MDAGKLVQNILEARDIVRGVLPKYVGKPYTGYTMNCMEDEANSRLDIINRELREELGIELYAVIATPSLNFTNGSASAFLEARKYEGQGKIEKSLNKNLLCD